MTPYQFPNSIAKRYRFERHGEARLSPMAAYCAIGKVSPKVQERMRLRSSIALPHIDTDFDDGTRLVDGYDADGDVAWEARVDNDGSVHFDDGHGSAVDIDVVNVSIDVTDGIRALSFVLGV